MGKIFYAVSGEGRGHATRACTLLESLRDEHEIVLYAPDLAYEVLQPRYHETEVEVRRLPGLRFYYSQDRSLSYWKTSQAGLTYVWRLPQLLARLQRDFDRDQPDLVITDFEPSLPRAARRAGVPFISLDHQHFLVTYDLSSLPFHLRSYAALMALVVRTYFSGQAHSIVSSFYFPPLRPGLTDVTQVGVLLRRSIREAQPEDGAHIVAYLRRSPPPSVIESMAECGCEVRVYGLGRQTDQGALQFREVDVERFAEDLATSRALITTAGNQLVGEALYLGKPVLAMPEDLNREQEINAHFLCRSGAGQAMPPAALTPRAVRRFLDASQSFQPRIERSRLCGNATALQKIQQYLSPATSARAAAA